MRSQDRRLGHSAFGKDQCGVCYYRMSLSFLDDSSGQPVSDRYSRATGLWVTASAQNLLLFRLRSLYEMQIRDSPDPTAP